MVRVHLLLPQPLYYRVVIFLFSRLKHHPATLPCLSANKVGVGGDVSLDCRNRATLVIRGSLFRRVSTASLASLSVHSLLSTCFYQNHSIVEWLFFLFSRLEHHHATLPCFSANKVRTAHIHLQVIFFQYTIQTKPSTFL